MYNYPGLRLANWPAGTKICPTMCTKQLFLIGGQPAGRLAGSQARIG